MKIIKILTISCLLYSCSNPLDKSILNPLEIEELKKVIENDTTFEKLYTEIQTFRESILENEIQQVKWMDLSYQSLLDYKDFNNDSNGFNLLRDTPESYGSSMFGSLQYEDLKKAHESKDVDSIKTALEGINEAWKNASEEMYKAQLVSQKEYIDFLEKRATSPRISQEVVFIIGIVAGVGITIGAGYAMNQAAH